MKKLSSRTLDLCQLNNDTPFDVLSRLPADKLLELRKVSKKWQTFISDPDFRHVQMKTADRIPISGYFFQERFEYSETDLENLSYIPLRAREAKIYQDVLAFLPEKVTILASSNGLICCRSCIPSSDPSIYICNPVNKEWIKLKWGNLHRRDNIAFSFNPNPSSSINAARDYKLVKVFETDNFTDGNEEHFFAFEIYDWEMKRWVKSIEVCQSDDSLCRNKRILFQGVLYCITDAFEVLTFDIENQLSLLVSLPVTVTDRRLPEICLGECDGVLSSVVVSENALMVWALEDRFTSKWNLRSFLSFEAMEEKNPEYLLNLAERVAKSTGETTPWMNLLAFQNGNLFMRVSNSVFSFDIQSMKMRPHCSIMDLGRQAITAPTVIPYSISLAPLAHH